MKVENDSAPADPRRAMTSKALRSMFAASTGCVKMKKIANRSSRAPSTFFPFTLPVYPSSGDVARWRAAAGRAS